MIVEGQKVVYAGDSDPFQDVGSHGKVIAMSGPAAHVQWSDGPKVGAIDLVDLNDIVPDRHASVPATTVAAAFDDSLDMPSTQVLAVRATYDEAGEEGLLTALDDSGHLAMLSDYVDEAVGFIAGRVRQDPSMSEVLAHLEPDEADGLVGRVASVLLSDRLRES